MASDNRDRSRFSNTVFLGVKDIGLPERPEPLPSLASRLKSPPPAGAPTKDKGLPPNERVADASFASDRDRSRHYDDGDAMSSRAPPPRYPRAHSPATSIASSADPRARKPSHSSVPERVDRRREGGDRADPYRDEARWGDEGRRREEGRRYDDRRWDDERRRREDEYEERRRREPRSRTRSPPRQRSSPPPPFRKELSDEEKKNIWKDRVK